MNEHLCKVLGQKLCCCVSATDDSDVVCANYIL